MRATSTLKIPRTSPTAPNRTRLVRRTGFSKSHNPLRNDDSLSVKTRRKDARIQEESEASRQQVPTIIVPILIPEIQELCPGRSRWKGLRTTNIQRWISECPNNSPDGSVQP